MNFLRLIISCLFLALSGTIAAAQTDIAFGAVKADTSLPVEVTADQLDVNQSDGTALFTGNVAIGQGQMRMTADQVLVVYDANTSGIARLEATGNVVLVSGPDAAEAQRADYSVNTGTIVMTGDVLLTQGQNALTSETMSIDLATGSARMSGRVKTILAPGGRN